MYVLCCVCVVCVCRPYYGLGEEFPSSQLLTRSVAGKKRNIYLTSALVKELLQRNEFHVKVCVSVMPCTVCIFNNCVCVCVVVVVVVVCVCVVHQCGSEGAS